MDQQYSPSQHTLITRHLWRVMRSSLLLLLLSASTSTAAPFVKVLDTFDTLPGTTSFVFIGGASGTPALDNGKVAVTVRMDNVPQAVWIKNIAGGAPLKLVDSNTAIPAGAGTFAGEVSPIRMRNGRVVFRGYDNGQFGNQVGYYGIAATGGAITKLVDKNTPIPGGGGAMFPVGQFGGFNSDGSTVVFGQAPGGIHTYAVPAAGGAVTAIDKQMVICKPSRTYGGFFVPDVSGTQVALIGIAFGDRGAIFRAPLSGFVGVTDPCATPALMATNATRIASWEENVPGDPLARKFEDFRGFQAPVIDGTTIVFGAQATFATGQTRVHGIYSHTPTTGLRKLVDTTTPVPGGVGTFRVNEFGGTQVPSYTLSGNQVVFLGSDATGRQGLYHVAATGGPIRKVVAVNDVVGVGRRIVGSTGPSSGFASVPIQVDSLQGARLAFRADFFDTARNAAGTGIFVTNAATGGLPFASIGIFRPSSRAWAFDASGNGTWNGCVVDKCQGPFGVSTDTPVIGHWNGGLAKIGVFRQGVWYLDFNGNGQWNGTVVDRQFTFGGTTDLPVVGDWTGTGTTKIGIYRPGTRQFFLDKDGNGVLGSCAVDTCLGPFGITGDRPVVGDWTGDGKAKIGVYRPATRLFILDRNNNGILEACTIDLCSTAFGAAGDVPLVGDWTGNGLAKIGVYRPGTRQFFLDKNGNRALDACGVDGCLGAFGLAGDKPVVGAW